MKKLSILKWIFLIIAVFLAGFFDSKYFLASLSKGLDLPNVENLPESAPAEMEELPPADIVLTEQERQNMLDDIGEKLDIIQQQINELIAERNSIIEKKEEEKDRDKEDKKDDEDEENEIDKEKEKTKHSNSGAVVTYPKILISEVALGDNEFVEFFNPNNFSISLNSWYLQRKTKSGTGFLSFVAKNQFSGEVIGSNDYFLIARQGSFFENVANVVIDEPLTDNNTLFLKNPNEEISDKIGFGEAQDFETAPFLINPPDDQSLGRVFDETSQTYLDTDNNSADFELDTPTPKTKNIKYIAPKNIFINEIQVSGLTSENEEFVELYNPNAFDVDLTGYILQRKTKGGSVSSYVTGDLFFGEVIGSNDYFLIAKEGSSLAIVADIKTSGSLGYFSAGGSTLILKKSGASNFYDTVAFGDALDSIAPNPPKGKSIGRNYENNFVIFKNPTPRKENKEDL